MKKLVVAVVAALAMCAPALSAGLVQRAAEQNVLYNLKTLPRAVVGTKYDVTMIAKYTAANGGGYASLGTQMTLTTASEVSPGILFRSGKEPGGSSLILVGTPTAPGTFHFATCVVFSDGSCELKQWTLVVAGKAIPTWLAPAKDTKDELELALRNELEAKTLINDEEYSRAESLLEKSIGELASARRDANEVESAVSSGSAGKEATSAALSSQDAWESDVVAKVALGAAEEGGDREQASKAKALRELSAAIDSKQQAINRATSMIAAGEAS